MIILKKLLTSLVIELPTGIIYVWTDIDIYLSYFTKYQQVFKRNIRGNLSQYIFRKYLNLQYIEATKKSFAEMQKNIDVETLRFSDLVLSYTMFINELLMAITIIVFLFFFNFKITLILSVIFTLMFTLIYFALRNKFKSWGIKAQEAHNNCNNTIYPS